MRHLIACSTLLFLIACADTAPAPVAVASAAPAASAPDVKMVCHREEQIGSHMNHTVCEPENKDSWEAQQTARAIGDAATRVNPSAVKTSGH